MNQNYLKYLKYKKKYTNLKKFIGGYRINVKDLVVGENYMMMCRDGLLKKIIIIDKGLYHQDSKLRIKIFKDKESALSDKNIEEKNLFYWVNAKYINEEGMEGDYVFNEYTIITDKTIDIHFENIKNK